MQDYLVRPLAAGITRIHHKLSGFIGIKGVGVQVGGVSDGAGSDCAEAFHPEHFGAAIKLVSDEFLVNSVGQRLAKLLLGTWEVGIRPTPHQRHPYIVAFRAEDYASAARFQLALGRQTDRGNIGISRSYGRHSGRFFRHQE